MAKTVLLIDDDVDLVTAATAALELAGYAVLAAHTGAEGLAKAKAESPDAIVLDVTMETVGAGFKVARALREDETTRRIPLLMLTSINRTDAGLRYGADEDWNPVDVFLDKPVSAEQLVQQVGGLLGDAEA